MDEVIKKGRGAGKKPALVYFPLRLPQYVLEFFGAYSNKNAKIREVLINYVANQKGKEDENTKQEITEDK
jgi:hypothetical protein